MTLWHCVITLVLEFVVTYYILIRLEWELVVEVGWFWVVHPFSWLKESDPVWYCRLSSPRNDRGTAGRQFIQYRQDCPRNSRAYTFSAIVIPKLIHLKGAGRGGFTMIFLWNLFLRLQLSRKHEPVTELFRGSWTQPPTGARGATTPIFGLNMRKRNILVPDL